MLHLADVIQPKPEEHVAAVFRRHRLTLLPSLCLAGVFIAVPFFGLFSLTRSGGVGVVAFALLLAAGVTIGLRSLLLWDANTLIVTNERLIRVSQHGIWHRTVQEVPLRSIHELVCESRGIFETLFRVGTLRVRSGGTSGGMVIKHLASPQEARTLIDDLRGASHVAASREGHADLRKEVHALVDHASLSTLETVKALLNKSAS